MVFGGVEAAEVTDFVKFSLSLALLGCLLALALLEPFFLESEHKHKITT